LFSCLYLPVLPSGHSCAKRREGPCSQVPSGVFFGRFEKSFLRYCFLHKRFFEGRNREAAKPKSTRRAAGRRKSTEASDRGKAGEIRERWRSMETPADGYLYIGTPSLGRQRMLPASLAPGSTRTTGEWVNHASHVFASLRCCRPRKHQGEAVEGEFCGVRTESRRTGRTRSPLQDTVSCMVTERPLMAASTRRSHHGGWHQPWRCVAQSIA
jgi:hypothetical protein